MKNLVLGIVFSLYGGIKAFPQNVSFVIQCPEVVDAEGEFVYDAYFKNESQNRIKLPVFVFGGPDRIFYHKLYSADGKELQLQFVPEYGLSSQALTDSRVEVVPGGLIGSVDNIKSSLIFPGPGKYRIQFIWEGRFAKGNKQISKYVVEKWIIVK